MKNSTQTNQQISSNKPTNINLEDQGKINQDSRENTLMMVVVVNNRTPSNNNNSTNLREDQNMEKEAVKEVKVMTLKLGSE
jgi:uncharacterized membrane protein